MAILLLGYISTYAPSPGGWIERSAAACRSKRKRTPRRQMPVLRERSQFPLRHSRAVWRNQSGRPSTTACWARLVDFVPAGGGFIRRQFCREPQNNPEGDQDETDASVKDHHAAPPLRVSGSVFGCPGR